MSRRGGALLGAVLLLGACRAQVGGPADLAAAEDFAYVPSDGATPDSDLTPPNPCADAHGPEQCSNGCDDDGNGFVDGDDPACTPQLIVTTAAGTSSLDRLFLPASGAPYTRPLDGNATGPGVFAARSFAFDPAVFVVHDGSPALVRRLALSATGTGSYSDYAAPWPTRDVCIFNGDLVIVERGNLLASPAKPSRLHRLAPDGKSERAALDLGLVLATSCASDGAQLYVAVHDGVGGASSFVVLDNGYAKLASSPWALPTGLPSGVDRCLDVAYVPNRGFYGLFTNAAGETVDSKLSAQQLWPFSFDGGVGAPLDAGVLHGIGEMR